MSDQIWSDVHINGERQTWKELFEREAVRRSQADAYAGILFDLDRCEHGRHQGDVCGNCGGPSKGNPRMAADRIIGFNISGKPYRFPERHESRDAEDWVES